MAEYFGWTERGRAPSLAGATPNRLSSGEGGIRTLDRRENAYNGFRDRRIQPLCHLSER